MPGISGSIISVPETTLFITSFTTPKNDSSSLKLLFEIVKMSEDERYRQSSQYRDWSFTPKALLDLRTITNQNAACASAKPFNVSEKHELFPLAIPPMLRMGDQTVRFQRGRLTA